MAETVIHTYLTAYIYSFCITTDATYLIEFQNSAIVKLPSLVQKSASKSDFKVPRLYQIENENELTCYWKISKD